MHRESNLDSESSNTNASMNWSRENNALAENMRFAGTGHASLSCNVGLHGTVGTAASPFCHMKFGNGVLEVTGSRQFQQTGVVMGGYMDAVSPVENNVKTFKTGFPQHRLPGGGALCMPDILSALHHRDATLMRVIQKGMQDSDIVCRQWPFLKDPMSHIQCFLNVSREGFFDVMPTATRLGQGASEDQFKALLSLVSEIMIDWAREERVEAASAPYCPILSKKRLLSGSYEMYRSNSFEMFVQSIRLRYAAEGGTDVGYH